MHLNGRVYDPMVGRMISADPTVPDPLNAQMWNRYSYVGNDPLAFTDPSGFGFFSSFFRAIGGFFSGVAHFLSSNPIVKAIVQIAATAVLTIALAPLAAAGYAALAASFAAAGGSAIVTGLSGGNLGQILRAGAIAGATAFAFNVVGDLTLGPAHASPAFGSEAHLENIAGHALVGCGASVASGGSCESGALSGAVTAGAGPLINGQRFEVALVENAVLGGVASVAGGGKFANGAITGAFGYMFNACGADPNGCMKLGASLGTALGIAASAGCDLGTVGACALANPSIVLSGSAGGGAFGAAVDNLVDGVHGNSLDSQRQTYVYQLVDQTSDDILKYGITSEANPYSRYSVTEYDSMNAKMQVLGAYPTRFMARAEELRLNGNYVIQNGSFPPKTFRW